MVDNVVTCRAAGAAFLYGLIAVSCRLKGGVAASAHARLSFDPLLAFYKLSAVCLLLVFCLSSMDVHR